MHGLRREEVVEVEIEAQAEGADVEDQAVEADLGAAAAVDAITTAHGVRSDVARCGLSMKLYGR